MALERLYAEGKVRAIGVSNFTRQELQIRVESNHIKPMINQIEIHPGYPQEELVRYCKKHQIAVAASAPLARGEVFDNTALKELADKYEKSVPQIILRWHVQRGVIPLPKTVHAHRIQENMQIFDFSLDSREIDTISSLPGRRIFSDPV
jgi:diketogulonate reductase-like aldo/keto reductase